MTNDVPGGCLLLDEFSESRGETLDVVLEVAEGARVDAVDAGAPLRIVRQRANEGKRERSEVGLAEESMGDNESRLGPRVPERSPSVRGDPGRGSGDELGGAARQTRRRGGGEEEERTDGSDQASVPFVRSVVEGEEVRAVDPRELLELFPP
jgi:hypothetical protein